MVDLLFEFMEIPNVLPIIGFKIQYTVKRYILVIGIIAFVIAVDQMTKIWAVENLMNQPSTSYLGGFFRFTFARNEGAFLSLGSGLSGGWKTWALTILPVVVLLYILFQTLFSKSMGQWQIIAFSFILGGGLSNIYDRIVHGSVVDFMVLEAFGWHTGIFNIADNAIMLGLFMMIPTLFSSNKKKEKPLDEEA